MPSMCRAASSSFAWVTIASVIVIQACGSDNITGPKKDQPNAVHLQSDPGDFVGAGKTWDYTSANAIISVGADHALLTVTVDGDETWRGDFELPNSLANLRKGTYANLDRLMFNDPVKGGLSWVGDGRGCNTSKGTIVIDDVTYSGTTLTAIDLHFEQHCEGAAPALRGTVHWRAADQTAAAGPVNPIPSGLWRPPSGSVPASGNYVYLASEPGDYIGQGSTHLYTPGTSTLDVSASGGHLTVSVGGGQWFGDFQTMNTLTQLQVGYYPNLQRYPFNNPARGGLSWYGEGRGCNTLTGWFVVDAVAYSGTSLTSIDLRFEQHCEGGGPALHGAIHWHV